MSVDVRPFGAVVTGGGRGIGAAVAAALTRAGGRVTVAARSLAQLEAVVRRGDAAMAARCDVTREAEVAELVAAHEARVGACDVLVCCAGILERGLVERLAPERFRAVLEVNLTGAFLCARAALPGMKGRRRGRIVNVASISGTLGTPEGSAYNASKWGLIGFTKSLAEELRGAGVQALSVSPGSVDTEMLRETPFEPQMTPAEVAKVIAFCALEAPDAMNGANVEVFG
ncbi:SDR family NAD(P)-dependent oxidoreductase [Anaeromyxobacter paludicola]|uniref:Beta-ketoacyl-ACP reductase n=1 Tax=Anaeromyxobacter paludicola TaxID=2918171 RepID=A0ABN6N2N1_9BACT|nr:SDR family oxidoreductase [Anaeromyxobacter paludicola]BDG07460.1 beta-ketoacyl-ACP reductase [Anaeromyxobacter paludicola]